MVPPPPTAVPVLASTKKTATRILAVPLDWGVQVSPPSVVRRVVPTSPTPTTVFRSGIAAGRSVFPCGRGFCHNQPDCAKDGLIARMLTPKKRTETLNGIFILLPSQCRLVA